MGFFRQEYWSGLPCPPGEILTLGLDPCLLLWQVGSLPLATPGKPPREAENGTQESSFNTGNFSDVSWKRGTEEGCNNSCRIPKEGNWPFSSTTEDRQEAIGF